MRLATPGIIKSEFDETASRIAGEKALEESFREEANLALYRHIVLENTGENDSLDSFPQVNVIFHINLCQRVVVSPASIKSDPENNCSNVSVVQKRPKFHFPVIRNHSPPDKPIPSTSHSENDIPCFTKDLTQSRVSHSDSSTASEQVRSF